MLRPFTRSSMLQLAGSSIHKAWLQLPHTDGDRVDSGIPSWLHFAHKVML